MVMKSFHKILTVTFINEVTFTKYYLYHEAKSSYIVPSRFWMLRNSHIYAAAVAAKNLLGFFAMFMVRTRNHMHNSVGTTRFHIDMHEYGHGLEREFRCDGQARGS